MAGLIGIVVISATVYLLFGGSLPFQGSPFVLKAVFTTNTQLHIPSPVRIAGIDVGQVVSVSRVSKNSTAGLVTMDINPNGLPIHADATAAIRTRIFLEGNFYVDLSPGTPSAPLLVSGATLPASNTSGPVQLDRILSALNDSARENLQTLLQGIGGSLYTTGGPAQNANQDPSVRSLTGGQALNKSLQYSVAAFRGSSIVNEALLGIQPHDLSNAVIGQQQVLKALADSGSSLPSFVHTFNATMRTLASRQTELEQTIALLPPFLKASNAANTQLQASFGPTQEFARAILPGVEQSGPTIAAGIPWLKQATLLFSKPELGNLLTDLVPAIQSTSATVPSTQALVTQLDDLALCFSHDITPAGNEVINDPPVGTSLKVYQELFQSAVGIAGAAGNFDGNGRYVRASAGGGDILAQTPNVGSAGPFFGNFVLQPLGTRPAFAVSSPPLRRSVLCFKNAVPNLNAAATGAGP
jgi:ABC-type transporter Mla subunit MlaD